MCGEQQTFTCDVDILFRPNLIIAAADLALNVNSSLEQVRAQHGLCPFPVL